MHSFFRQLYHKSDVQELTKYARQRGVILLPEFDAPAHAAFGWNFGPSKGFGNLATCMHTNWVDPKTGDDVLAAEPPAGQLNPVNDKVYEVRSILLVKLFGDVSFEKFREFSSEFLNSLAKHNQSKILNKPQT